jgi:anti-sigma factor RsiW
VTQPTNHVDDAALSALVDRQLTPDETARVQAHLEACSACQERLDGFRSVANLLQALPEIDPPRDFLLGPRLLVDPPNVVRLRRWYTVARTAAASLAAVFVLLSGGALYLGMRPVATATSAPFASKPQNASGAAPELQSAPPTAAVRSSGAVAAVAPAASPATGAGALARPAPVNPQADDQVAAATSIRPLPPTPVPTPRPTAVTAPLLAPVASASPDSAVPLRNGAVVAGILAVLALLAALVARHRLQRNPSQL